MMPILKSVKSLLEYKKWANELTFNAVSNLPKLEIDKGRTTRFKTITNTLNHVYVVDDIFKAHLTQKDHGYTCRNTESHPPLKELWDLQRNMDNWYLDYASSLSQKELTKVIKFSFV